MKRKDGQLDELLSRGTLGGPAYDEILKRVLAHPDVAPRSPRRRVLRWFAGSTAVLVPVTAAWLLLVRGQQSSPTPKGGAGAAAIEVGCGTAGGHVCRPGDTLMFSVNAAVASGHVGAYAERVGDPARERIWYFPTASGASPMVVPGSGTVVLPDGIRIGPEHAPGDYRVTTWIADRPISRAEIDGRPGAPATTSTIELRVVPQ